MKSGFTSLNGTILVSALSLLAFTGYVLMEMRYFLGKWIPGESGTMAVTILIQLIVGAWLWALFTATNGTRGSLIALLIFSGFALLIALYDLQFLFPPNSTPWPEKTMILVMLIISVLAMTSLSFFLRQGNSAG